MEEERDTEEFFKKSESKKNEIHSHFLDTLNNLGDAIKKSQQRIERSGKGVLFLIEAQKEKAYYRR